MSATHREDEFLEHAKRVLMFLIPLWFVLFVVFWSTIPGFRAFATEVMPF